MVKVSVGRFVAEYQRGFITQVKRARGCGGSACLAAGPPRVIVAGILGFSPGRAVLHVNEEAIP
ncbi:hypothetical protein SAMN05192579_11632 [Rhodanobacter glycinis]|uniref:Uncharacterized protein n=1 Tax=Rhodanobacter glycinis TaxID=582702 RepID=A0A1I4F8D8_9GAMM|nr:hypothetical protein SAMN05192579_11632 [Rhodanobacter glycinis]